MPSPINAIGRVYSRLTVVEKAAPRIAKNGKPRTRWLCRCECGNDAIVDIAKLQNGHTKSCGCLHVDATKKANTTHGLRTGYTKQSKEYRAWTKIRYRCENPTNPKYHLYGARGIAVCERWMDFVNFLEDMGEAPTQRHSIDRINTNGNYEPSNCRWATAKQQANNLRTTRFFTVDDVTDTISGWTDRMKTTRATITNRLKRGEAFEHIYAVLASRLNP